MYKVTTGTPTDSKATEYWFDELRAYLRSDIINKTTDEFTGAIVQEVSDSENHATVDYFYQRKTTIEYTWENKCQLSNISCLIEIIQDVWINCGLEVRLDVNGDDVSYVIQLGDITYQHEQKGNISLNINSKTSIELGYTDYYRKNKRGFGKETTKGFNASFTYKF